MVLQEELYGAIGGGFSKLGLNTHLSESDTVWVGLAGIPYQVNRETYQ